MSRKIILYSENRKYSQDLITPLGLIFLFCLCRHILFHHLLYKYMWNHFQISSWPCSADEYRVKKWDLGFHTKWAYCSYLFYGNSFKRMSVLIEWKWALWIVFKFKRLMSIEASWLYVSFPYIFDISGTMEIKFSL